MGWCAIVRSRDIYRLAARDQKTFPNSRTISAQQLIEQIKRLPSAQVAKFVVDNDDSWIPQEYKEAIKDAGRDGWRA